MRPLIIVPALVNKMGRTRLTRGKDIGGGSELGLIQQLRHADSDF
jgi:hypothetical protein